MLKYFQQEDCVEPSVFEGQAVYIGYHALKILFVAMPTLDTHQRGVVDVDR
jgi:hypothetical protein